MLPDGTNISGQTWPTDPENFPNYTRFTTVHAPGADAPGREPDSSFFPQLSIMERSLEGAPPGTFIPASGPLTETGALGQIINEIDWMLTQLGGIQNSILHDGFDWTDQLVAALAKDHHGLMFTRNFLVSVLHEKSHAPGDDEHER